MENKVQQELQEQRKILEQATAKIKEIEESLAREKEPVLWEPLNDQAFHFCLVAGGIAATIKGTAMSSDIIANHNCFQDEAIARIHSKQIRLFNQLRRIAIAIDPERKGLGKRGQENWRPYYNGVMGTFCSTIDFVSQYEIYFSSGSLAEKAYSMLDDENKRTFQGDYT